MIRCHVRGDFDVFKWDNGCTSKKITVLDVQHCSEGFRVRACLLNYLKQMEAHQLRQETRGASVIDTIRYQESVNKISKALTNHSCHTAKGSANGQMP